MEFIERWLNETTGDTVSVPKDILWEIYSDAQTDPHYPAMDALGWLIPKDFFPEDEQEKDNQLLRLI